MRVCVFTALVEEKKSVWAMCHMVFCLGLFVCGFVVLLFGFFYKAGMSHCSIRWCTLSCSCTVGLRGTLCRVDLTLRNMGLPKEVN